MGEAIALNLRIVQNRIQAVCQREGVDPQSVVLVAVTKTVGPQRVRQAVAAGVRNVGENRVQEAREKRAALAELSAVWHLVGHLQRNKAREAVGLFDLIQSLDSAELAAEIDRRARAAGKVQEVLVEVNSSGQESKFGVSPEATVDFIAPLGSLRGIRVRGLMTVGPWPSTPPETRKAFRRLRDLRDRIAALNLAGISMDYLSMGMTQDFETALEEGSNMVRIGTAIFGERDGA